MSVQNYRIGAVLTEMYTHAEHLQKTAEIKTRGYGRMSLDEPGEEDGSCPACCTGVLEANLNSNVIGVAHIDWIWMPKLTRSSRAAMPSTADQSKTWPASSPSRSSSNSGATLTADP